MADSPSSAGAGPSAQPASRPVKVSKPKTKPTPQPIEAFKDPGQGEQSTVHEIYEQIAPHFAQTRHKPWPLITSFLNSLPADSVGLDSGAGNGKYLPTAKAARHGMIALDRSRGLLDLAAKQDGGEDVVRGDLGARCWRDGVFDFTISVAAIHHLSTPIRRRQAVQAILPPLRLNKRGPYSRFFIYVWAYEQGELSKRAMGSAAGPSGPGSNLNSTSDAGAGVEAEGVREEEGEEGEKIQDVLVPWVLKPNNTPKPKSKPKVKTPAPSKRTRKSKTPAGIEEDPPIPELELKELKLEQDEAEAEGEINGPEAEGEGEKVYHRYYHLFIRHELRDLVVQAGEEEGYRILPDAQSEAQREDLDEGIKWLRVREVGWEADNWYLEGEVGVGPYLAERAE